MPIVDLLVLGVIFISIIVGCIRGFVYEAMMLCGWVIAFFVAKYFAPDLAETLQNAIQSENWRISIAFILIFILVLFVNGILASLLKKLFSKAALRPIDRCLGGVFGLFRAAIILLVVTLIVYILRLQGEPWWTQSKSSPVLDEMMTVSRPFLRSVLSLDDEVLAEKVDQLGEVGEQVQKMKVLKDSTGRSLEDVGEQGHRTQEPEQKSDEAQKDALDILLEWKGSSQ